MTNSVNGVQKPLRWILQLCGFAALLTAISCGSVPRTNYYSLRVPAVPVAQAPRSQAVLGIERFGAPEALRHDRLVYYPSPTEVGFYDYHRWVSDPASMLRENVAARLRQAGLFTDVVLLPARAESNYHLRGRVLNFEEVDYDGGVSGRAGLELTLVRTGDRQVVWSASRVAKVAATGQGHAAVVGALDAASEQVLGELVPPLLSKAEEDLNQGAK